MIWKHTDEDVEAFIALPADQQKARAAALGLTKEGDEKRTNMTELCLWTIRGRDSGKLDDLFIIKD